MFRHFVSYSAILCDNIGAANALCAQIKHHKFRTLNNIILQFSSNRFAFGLHTWCECRANMFATISHNSDGCVCDFVSRICSGMHSMEAWSGHFCIGTRGHNMQRDAMFILCALFLVAVRSFILLFRVLIYDARQVQHTRSIVQIAVISSAHTHTPPQSVRIVDACTWNTKVLQRLIIINIYGCGNGYTVYGV